MAPTRITAPDIRARKGGTPVVMVTAYDNPTARLVDDAGVDAILVGDSVGNVVLGYDSTLEVTVEDILHHLKAVTRARPNALVVGDMPWLSYHVSREETVRNAGRFVQEGLAGAVKLEGGTKRLPMIQALLDAEIPVMGHIGLTPQSIHAMGGYKVQGRGLGSAEALRAEAVALERVGCFALVLEGVPHELAALITEEIEIPTIGIGAGPDCDGQVLVFHDLVGLGSGTYPKFVRTFAETREVELDAVRRFVDAVRAGTFPSLDESYRLPPDVAAALLRPALLVR